MKTKLAFSVVLAGLLVLTVRTVSSSRDGKDQSQAPNAEKRGTIAWHVKQAKAKGKKKVSLLPIEENHAVVTSLEDAFSQYTVVVAQLIEKKSFAREASIVTWNKLEVIETLSQPATPVCPKCLSGLNAPDDMLPQADEILVPTQGGKVVVDEVEVEAKDIGLGEHFKQNQKYLLFLFLEPTRRVGRIALIQYGVFTMDADDRIDSIADEDAPLKRDLRTRFRNSLNVLREHSKRSPKG